MRAQQRGFAPKKSIAAGPARQFQFLTESKMYAIEYMQEQRNLFEMDAANFTPEQRGQAFDSLFLDPTFRREFVILSMEKYSATLIPAAPVVAMPLLTLRKNIVSFPKSKNLRKQCFSMRK